MDQKIEMKEDEDVTINIKNKQSKIRLIFIILTCTLMQAFSMGIIGSFGIFIAYYKNYFKQGYFEISIIGTLSAGITSLFSGFVGKMVNQLGYKKTSLIGLIFIFTSLFFIVFTHQIWHLILLQGFLFAIGSSIFYIISYSYPSIYFSKRLGSAQGIVTSGCGIGGAFFSFFNFLLLEKLGYHWTLSLNGILILIIMLPLILIFIIDDHPKEKSIKQKLNYKHFLNLNFFLFTLQIFLIGFIYDSIFYYLDSSAQFVGLSSEESAILTTIINIFTLIGGILFGFFVDKLSTSTLLGIIYFGLSLSSLFWIFCYNIIHFVLFSSIMGLLLGGFNCLSVMLCIKCFGKENVSIYFGIVTSISGVSVVLGPSLMGYIIDKSKNFDYLSYISCTLFSICLISVIAIQINSRNNNF